MNIRQGCIGNTIGIAAFFTNRSEREDHRPGEEALPAEAGRGKDGHRGLHILGQNTRQGLNWHLFDLEKLFVFCREFMALV